MRFKLILFFVILSFQYCLGQGLSNNWLLGYLPTSLVPGTSAKAKLNFYNGLPDTSSIQTKMKFDRTQANISDKNGNLLMSSNGIFIANALGDTMLNGDSLNPDPYVLANAYPWGALDIVHGNVILPFPSDSTKYILFHQSVVGNPLCCHGILYYSIIDVSLDGGLGAVIQKNILLPLPQQNGGIAATKHANGRDWWILVAQDTSNIIWKILLTPSGITSITSQAFPVNLTFFDSASQSCFSQDGTKYTFTTIRHITANKHENLIRYFNFNRCSGNLSELTTIPIPDTLICYGLAFSPNSDYLYACSNKVIYQIDTKASNIAASIDTVAVYDGFTTPPGNFSNEFELMYLAHNNKIYISTYSSSLTLHCINEPDSAGIACDVQQHSLAIPCYNFVSVPNHPNYFLGADVGSPCDTLLNAKAETKEKETSFYAAPNPASKEVNIVYSSTAHQSSIELADLSGKILLTVKLPANQSNYLLTTENIPEGIYFLRHFSADTVSKVTKLVILK